MIGWRLVRAGCALACIAVVGAWSGQSADPDVALAPFAVVGPKADQLRPVADDCLRQLTSGLAAKEIKTVRLKSLDEKTLAQAKPARWAVLGRLERKEGTIDAELRLMDVATGEELRSYLHRSAEAKEIAGLGARAAERIAIAIKEQRASQPKR
jgi:hypothetical protein